MTELAKREDTEVAPIIELMRTVEDPSKLAVYEQMYERAQARRAKAAFDAAMAQFKAVCPPIPRRHENPGFKVTRGGVSVNSRYASLDDIDSAIQKPLAECGLSYTWEDTKIEGDFVTFVCVVSHELGHSKRTPCPMPLDPGKQGGSRQQQFRSVSTYGRRLSLEMALGLTTCEEDDDGAGRTGSAEPITENQAANIYAMMADVGVDETRFLAWVKTAYGADSVETIPALGFHGVIRFLEQKRRSG